MAKKKLFKVGEYKREFNEILNTNLPCGDIMQSVGLAIHVKKRHPACMKYLDNISQIISSPDYIGTNPHEPNSIELVKCFDNNIQIGIKLDTKNDYLYVSTLFDVRESKITSRRLSGRLKEFTNCA